MSRLPNADEKRIYPLWKPDYDARSKPKGNAVKDPHRDDDNEARKIVQYKNVKLQEL